MSSNRIVSAVVSGSYHVSGAYDADVTEMARNRYDYVNENLKTKNFLTTRSGKFDIIIELVCFKLSMDSARVLAEISRLGYRPVEAREILALGMRYPDVQLDFPIIALDQPWVDYMGNRRVVYLDRYGKKRNALLIPYDVDWNDNCRFAIVKKATTIQKSLSESLKEL